MTYVGDVAEVFRIADHEMKKRARKNPSKKTSKTIPMPKIDSNPRIKGPLHVTKEFKDSHYNKQEEKKKKEIKEYELEIYKTLAKIKRLKDSLIYLDPKKKKDSKRIAHINSRLRDLDEKLIRLQKESGINLNKLDTGSKLGRLWNEIKERAQKLFKRAKDLFKKYREPIEGVLLAVIPIIGVGFFKKFFGF